MLCFYIQNSYKNIENIRNIENGNVSIIALLKYYDEILQILITVTFSMTRVLIFRFIGNIYLNHFVIIFFKFACRFLILKII